VKIGDITMRERKKENNICDQRPALVDGFNTIKKYIRLRKYKENSMIRKIKIKDFTGSLVLNT